MTKPLYIKQCKGKGRGVFCKQVIIKEELIESAPLIIIPAAQKAWVMESKLTDYFFNYCETEDALALALGFGSLYNHAEHSNADYRIDYDNRQIDFFALEDIPTGREICINYGGAYGKDYRNWFEDRNIPYQK
ncbi:SET domain-containing protein-lysine N-methyltransferase [Niabella soli]|uniref:Lysine methyltransferase n=1 Tax=Niabella soli DSM 19437 TaxID=929713 RepID=W0EVD3_9BACT|nr:SET domain-containing protein-lysine N-methyltransferase [Niabella soli]AHF14732.1 lysine methyltransferase [Niabella soli DSM 19437]